MTAEDTVDESPDDAGRGVEALHEDHGDLPGADVPNHAAPYPGDHPEKNFQKNIVEGRPDGSPGHGKGPQSHGIGGDPEDVVQIDLPAHVGQKHQQSRHDGDQGEQGIAKGRGRSDPDEEIPDDAAAGGGHYGHGGDPQNIHFFLHAHESPGQGKCNGAEYFKNLLEHIHLESNNIFEGV